MNFTPSPPPTPSCARRRKDGGRGIRSRICNILLGFRNTERVFFGPAVTGLHFQRVPRGTERDPSHGGRYTSQSFGGGLLVSAPFLRGNVLYIMLDNFYMYLK